MANSEHLTLLKQGVEVWNQWRNEHESNVPDLSGMDLNETKLSGVDVSRANLRGTSLSGANLSGADFTGADLSGANLSGADFTGADLGEANLSGNDLSGMDFSGTDLSGANLSRANLSEAKLSQTNLSSANLSGTDLSEADLSEANLSGANLSGANLSGANLSEMHLSDTDLSMTNLSEADLRGADLRGANVSRANLGGADLSRANLTAAKLWGTHRSSWSIEGVKCEHAFWDRDCKEPTHYAPGEFERLHSEGVKIELYYDGGIRRSEILSLPMLLQALEAQHEGCVLRLKSIEDAPGGAKATIIVDEIGRAQPTNLSTELGTQAQKLQTVQRLLLDEQHLRLEGETKVATLRELLKRAMSEKQELKIDHLGQIGDISGDIKVQTDDPERRKLLDLLMQKKSLPLIELESLSGFRVHEFLPTLRKLEEEGLLTLTNPDNILEGIATLRRKAFLVAQ